jgi:hypothetical protein
VDGNVRRMLEYNSPALGSGFSARTESPVASEWLERMRSIGYLSGGRTRDRERSGRSHPDSGKPFKAVTDEAGNVVTEHSDPGSGVSCRQDVEIRPDAVQVKGFSS